MEEEPRLKIPGVDRLDTMVDLLAKKPIEIEARMCSRARHRQADCSRCVEVCAPEALTFSEKVDEIVAIDFSRCNGCGACATVCPNGVFDYSFGLSDYELLQKIGLTVRDADEVYFACSKSEEAVREASIAVTCFSRLHEGLLFGAAKLGAKQVYLASPGCEDCSFIQADNIEVLLREVATLTGAFGFRTRFSLISDSEAVSACPTTALIEKEQPTRRELLEGMTGFLKKRSASWLDERLGPLMQKNQAVEVNGFLYRTPYKRKMLLGLAKDQKSRRKLNLSWLSYGGVLLDTANCSLCGDCALFCPTTAIAMESGDDGTHLVFYPAFCTVCGICELACRPGALETIKEIRTKDLATAAGRALKSAGGRYCCVFCSTEFAASEPAPLCPTCYELEKIRGNEQAGDGIEPIPITPGQS